MLKMTFVNTPAKPVVRARRSIGSQIEVGSLYVVNSVSVMGNLAIVRISQEWWPMQEFEMVWNVTETLPNPRCN